MIYLKQKSAEDMSIESIKNLNINDICKENSDNVEEIEKSSNYDEDIDIIKNIEEIEKMIDQNYSKEDIDEVLLLKDIVIDDILDRNFETDINIDKSVLLKNQKHVIAPGQRKIPVSSRNIPHYDEICFPTIYSGNKMTYSNVHINRPTLKNIGFLIID